MATCCKSEFKLQNFGFNGVSPDLFQHSQWNQNRWIYFVYRFATFGYVLGWFIYGYITALQQNFWQFLTYWTEGVLLIYYLVAFLISIYAVAIRNRTNKDSNEKLPWFYVINWMMFDVAVVSGFQISLLYWILLAPNRTIEQNLRPVTFHVHAVNSILLFIDVFVVAFPVRFYHFIYTMIYAALYSIFLAILHVTGVNSRVYSVIDYENNLGSAIGINFASIFIIPVILNSFVFGLYHIRAFIARKTVLKNVESQDEAKSKSGSTNGKINASFDED